jgi:hypothetical protein
MTSIRLEQTDHVVTVCVDRAHFVWAQDHLRQPGIACGVAGHTAFDLSTDPAGHRLEITTCDL